MNNANPADFSYPVFDRQLKNLLSMSQVLLEGWDDYSTTELNHDLRSLCIKSARICYLADIDRTLQQEAFNRQRLEPNYFFLEQFNDLVRGKLVPHLKATISQIREGKPFQGHTSPLFPISYSKVLPHLSDFLIEDGASVHALDVLQKDAEKIEKIEKEIEFDRWHGFKVRVVDSCEYIIRADKTDGMADYARGFGFLAHKGNCKFCAKRDSINREKQKKEIINEILNTLGYGGIE